MGSAEGIADNVVVVCWGCKREVQMSVIQCAAAAHSNGASSIASNRCPGRVQFHSFWAQLPRIFYVVVPLLLCHSGDNKLFSSLPSKAVPPSPRLPTSCKYPKLVFPEHTTEFPLASVRNRRAFTHMREGSMANHNFSPFNGGIPVYQYTNEPQLDDPQSPFPLSR